MKLELSACFHLTIFLKLAKTQDLAETYVSSYFKCYQIVCLFCGKTGDQNSFNVIKSYDEILKINGKEK